MPDVLIHADSVRSPELRHEVPLGIGDRFLYLEAGGTRVVVLSQMELVRLPDDGTLVRVRPEELGYDEIARTAPSRAAAELALVLAACRRFGLTDAVVPETFPLATADHLRENGIRLAADSAFFEGRRRAKNAVELAGIRRAQRAGEAAMAAVRTMLRTSEPDPGGVLVLDGEPLTCERLRHAAQNVIAGHDAVCEDVIVSHGAQTAVGHDTGSGPVRTGEPVVADIFPRDLESGCWADMTRTLVHGEPPDELRRMHALCNEALQLALAAVRPGVDTRALFQETCDFFHGNGYPTLKHKAPGEVLEDGFYHSLGHGVGLEVHEAPYMGRAGAALVAGDVIAIEPGLYRKGWGGCRIEDIVLVTEDGCESLTDHPYDLEA